MLRLKIESRIAIAVLAVLGIPAVFLVPPAVTFDGPSHYFRALQVSEGTMRAERFSDRAVGGRLPESHVRFVNSMLWSSYWGPGHDFMGLGEWSRLSTRAAALRGDERVEFTNTAVYSPANYVPQALGMRMGTMISGWPLLAAWLGCLFNLAGYGALVVAALQLAPRFERGVLLLSLCPLIVFQAASPSADAVNFALPLLFIAWAWRLRHGEVERPGAELAGLFAAGIGVALLKPVLLPVVACAALLPDRCFGGRRAARLAATALLFAGALAAWYGWNRGNAGIDVAGWFDASRPPPSGQVLALEAGPLGFLSAFGHWLVRDMAPQWPDLYAYVGGWAGAATFRLNSALSLVLLVGLLACEARGGPRDGRWAGLLALVAAAVIGATALSLWIYFGTPGVPTIPGFAGRYLYLPAAALAIAASELTRGGAPRVRTALFWAALAAEIAGTAAILVPVAARSL
ncbi:MAG TPA: DUF2142 domain-containing protein [Opitutaceae bacterium]|jgi:hypothetical protein